MGPACIFLRKGIAEKQRVRLGAMGKDGGKGKGSWDAGKRRAVTDTVEGGRGGVEHELRRFKNPRQHGGDMWVREGRVKSEVRTERWTMKEEAKGELG